MLPNHEIRFKKKEPVQGQTEADIQEGIKEDEDFQYRKEDEGTQSQETKEEEEGRI
jgi:hypothetical protein